MPAWSLKNGVQVDALDWFAQRLVRARALMPSANFDTVIQEDFAETVTSELVDTSGTVDASPETTLVRAGVVTVTAGDVSNAGAGSLKLTGSGAHVQAQNGGPWYVAALAKVIRPADSSGNTVDLVGLSNDAHDGYLALGLRGSTSTANWIGAALSGGILTTIDGPALDPSEAPVWHLAEFWLPVGGAIHFALDGVEFADTIDTANAPAVFGQLLTRATGQAGFVGVGQFDKWAVVCESMTVGEP